MAVQEIIIPYMPRSVFLPLHDRTQRFAATVAHRRAGKTVAEINDKIRAALSCPHKNPRVAYIAPFFKQAKTVAWTYLKEYGLKIPGSIANESELRLDFPSGGQVRLYGADNPDALRGIYLDDVTLDEYADMNPRLWPEVIRPTLIDRQGRASFIGTPKGRNSFFDICENAKTDPDWLYTCLKSSQTGLIPPHELDAARRSMSADQFEQEFECSFQAAIVGSYYGSLVNDMEAEGRVTNVPYTPSVPVITAWDLGYQKGNGTAIWFCQIVGREPRLIDYYEASNVGIDHYVSMLKAKKYNYGTHVFPHDAGHGSLRTGMTLIQQLEGMGLGRADHDLLVLPRDDVDPGVELVRQLLPQVWVDAKKCHDGLEAVKNYRRKFDDERKVFMTHALHDWASHGADALRYLAVYLATTDTGPRVIVPPQQYQQPSQDSWMSW